MLEFFEVVHCHGLVGWPKRGIQIQPSTRRGSDDAVCHPVVGIAINHKDAAAVALEGEHPRFRQQRSQLLRGPVCPRGLHLHAPVAFDQCMDAVEVHAIRYVKNRGIRIVRMLHSQPRIGVDGLRLPRRYVIDTNAQGIGLFANAAIASECRHVFLIDQGNPFGRFFQCFVEPDDLAGKKTPGHLVIGFPVNRFFVDVVGRRHVEGLNPDLLGIGGFDQRQQIELACWVVAGLDVEFVQVVFQLGGHFTGAREGVQFELIDVGQQLLQVQGLDALLRERWHVFDQELFAADAAPALADDQARFFRVGRFKQFARRGKRLCRGRRLARCRWVKLVPGPGVADQVATRFFLGHLEFAERDDLLAGIGHEYVVGIDACH
ncbi:hypothetical protein D3C71_1110690 [compost metagenome]